MTDLSMPDISPTRNQRVVLEHTQGPYAGLHQIMGHSDDFNGEAPPDMTDMFDIQPGSRTAQASLVKSTPRYLLYKELPA